MRDALALLEGQRITVEAIFRRFGNKPVIGLGIAPVLIGPVFTEHGDFLCDHLWLPAGKRFAQFVSLLPGTVLALRGTISSYTRLDGTTDYKLTHLRDLRSLHTAPPAHPEPAAGLGDRLATCLTILDQAEGNLTHLRRMLFPTGKVGRGDPYAALLEARGLLWSMRRALGEARGLYALLPHTTPEATTEGSIQL